MDRNTVTGFLLIGLILIAYTYYNQQQVQEQVEKDKLEKTTSPVETDKSSAYLDSVDSEKDTYSESEEAPHTVIRDDESTVTESQANKYGVFAPFASGTQKDIEIETDELIVRLSSKGGSIKYVELKNFDTYDEQPLILASKEQINKNLHFFLNNNKEINTRELYFESSSGNRKINGSETATLRFKIEIEPGRFIEQVYTFKGDDYRIDYQVNLEGMGGLIANNARHINLFWKQDIAQLEKSRSTEDRYSYVFYKMKDGSLESLSETSDDNTSVNESIEWISFKQQFFNSTLISEKGFFNATLKSDRKEEETDPLLKTMQASLTLPFEGTGKQSFNLTYLYSPNDFKLLKKYGNDLEEIVQLGPNFSLFAWIGLVNRYTIIPIFDFLGRFIGNYGLIIFLLTLLIKMVLFPLTYKSYKSMAMMKVLKPELDELKEKYKNDQQRQGTEQWKLYQKAGVSPLGGCLPMVLQMPFLIGMYYFFPSSIELRHEAFLWASDLSTYDSIYDLPFNIPFYGDHVSLFTLLMTVTSILYAVSNAQMSAGGNNMPGMKYMPYIFPVMLLGIFNNFPAALTYYYFLSNLISYAQQYFIKKFVIDDDKLLEQIKKNKKKPVKKNTFQKKLEEMAKQQQQKQKTKKK
ncbi:MAG: membrane protein insertase YidC [Chitinophagales bacterium]